MNDYIVSLIRTGVPLIIGGAITWLAAHLGIVIDDDTKSSVIGATVLAVVGVYYAVVRFLETKFPKIGWLLGKADPPTYPSTPPPAA